MIRDFFETCLKMQKTSVPDGFGGMVDTFTEGESFPAAIALNNSSETVVGERKALVKDYNVIIPDDVDLFQNDVFKGANGRLYRVTSNGMDQHTPSFSMMDVRCVSAEVIE